LRLAGRIRELCEQFDRYAAATDRTGDRYLGTNLRTYQTVGRRVRDNVARASKEIEGVLDAWPKDTDHVQQFFHLYGRCEQALYTAKPELAWQAIADESWRMRRSALFHRSGVCIEHAWICGRAPLTLAEKVSDNERLPLLRQARRSARRLRKSEQQTGVAMDAAINAGVRGAGVRWLSPGVPTGGWPSKVCAIPHASPISLHPAFVGAKNDEGRLEVVLRDQVRR
jgi:hypothetical protein